ncbi:SDR family NAD(P)-dependent oxidoreductase [Amycolatopsis pithecellobii]|uniref:SDR family oxidoreductase n=1 Tax=Amycolatopsis pithecellobii TaxID=664692 RepID=A0A6N7Z6L4_9PSEU|nr:SDR family oxidoreductase [Amycolatopsis pithecellobii]MTD57579.1 SDR family oxidoreductase [Amycolatopsis pithecellobii]
MSTPASGDAARVVAVTGAGSGIGLATASAFAAAGMTVVGLDLREGPPSEGVGWIPCDVADDASVSAAFAALGDAHGKLDVVVNNAGIGGKGTVETATDEAWLQVFGVNVFGVARVSRHAIPLLRAGHAATIVNVASSVAVAGTPLRAVYSASKGAVAALTRAMAADLVAEGIRVNAVYPGPVHTAVTGRYDADPVAARQMLTARMPFGHLIGADEIARAIVYLADPANRSLTGAEFRYDGGTTELVNFGTA